MDRNAKKQKKNAGVFSICHLSVPEFLPKKIYRDPAKKKGAPYFVQSGSEAKLYKQLSTYNCSFWIWRITTWNPHWEFEREGFLCKKLHLKAFILASFWIAEGKQRNEAE